MPAPADRIKSPAFYFPDFFLKELFPWFQHSHCEEIEIIELIKTLTPLMTDEVADYQWKNPYQTLFQTTFDELQEKFASKELAKAVPFVFENAEQKMTTSQLIKSLINVLKYALTSPTYLYGFWDQSRGILGATPELLFRFTQNGTSQLETVACAATSASSGNSLSLEKDPKELHEHQLVVQGIIESLSPFGNVNVGALKLLQLPKLIHLFTPISVQLKQIPHFDSVVRALHPTPALGAFPRESGMNWLHALQKKIDRKHYGAPVGFLKGDIHESCCYVAIRNAQWDQQKIFLGAGCGVVAQSQVDREWAEINLKLQAIKEMLAL